MYFNGQGVSKDYAEAVRLYKLAAAQGNIHQQLNLGVIYEEGTVVLQDYAEAARWYKLAAEQGNVAAQFNLSKLFDGGQVTAQNFVREPIRANTSGEENATKFRNQLAGPMTSQIAVAVNLVKECRRRNLKNCD